MMEDKVYLTIDGLEEYKKDIEICVRAIITFDELKEKMVSMGFKIQEDFQLNDIYMVENDREVSVDVLDDILSNYVLVRETVGKKIMLVMKNKEINEKGEVVSQKSIKCPIVDKEAGYNFMLNLGYKKFLELKAHNILLSNGKNEIYIQDVAGLGVYVEMEQKNLLLDNNNGNTLEELINNLKQYDLPIDDSNFFAKKAYDMFFKK